MIFDQTIRVDKKENIDLIDTIIELAMDSMKLNVY